MGKKLFALTVIIEFIIFMVSVPTILSAKHIKKVREILYPQMTYSPPKIDGILNDEIWKNGAIEKDFITYNPIYGDILPQKTLIWMAYDSKNLYFAFKCLDTEPKKIKTSITKRDNIFNDDWIGFSLDALGNKQSAYDFFVNPNGIQGDILNSAVSGENVSPDFIWDSAARITNEGYDAEIKIPLKSISFKSGKEVKMGILFWRKINRLSLKGSWPELKPGIGIFNIHADLTYKNLDSPLKLEMLPSLTFGSNSERIEPKKWDKGDSFKDIGIGLKCGITSSITSELTVNPDFSQVESDVFQVEVNQRYPVFYSEKRPFFMEGMEVFNILTVGMFLQTPVYTRKIVDPTWGAKLTGTAGKTAFGFLSAGDKWPGLAYESDTNPYEGKNAAFTILRGKHSFSGDNHIGGIYSGREFAGGYNRVIGTDFGFRFRGNHQISSSFLYSISGEPEEKVSVKSPNLNLLYLYNTKKILFATGIEHIGKDFRMDSAFLRRSGVSMLGVKFCPYFYPKLKNIPWLKKISNEMLYGYVTDLNTNLVDILFDYCLDFNFTKQGFLRLNYNRTIENWKSKKFNLSNYKLRGNIQITNWLKLGGSLGSGEQIYYNADPSYKGNGYNGSFYFTLQPSKNLNQYFEFYYTNLYKDNEKIYDINIINSRTTYQFNRYFFIRSIIQYNSYQKRMLTDFLASFTFIPGTVLHVGYGSLYENRRWLNNQWQYKQGDMFNTKRSFFFKASYLFRI